MRGTSPGCVRLAVDDGLFAERRFEQLDEPAQFHGLRFAEVENFVTEFLLRAGDDAVHDVADVGVIAFRGAVAVDRDRFAGVDELGELVNRQVRPLARAIDREEPQHRHVHAIDVMIDVAEGFTGQLAGGVRRNDREHRVAFRERHLGVHAIDRGGRGEQRLFHAMPPRRFQHVDRALDVDLLEKFRFIQAGPDAGAGRQMDDLIKRGPGEQIFQRPDVGQIFRRQT